MADRDTFIRESMRHSWGQRTAAYTDYAAPRTAAYTDLLLNRIGLRDGERVLDVACGPGVVALPAAAAVAARGHVVATDLAPEWGAVVERRAAEAGLTNVAFMAMGAEALDLPDVSFDVVLCQFGLMFVPEPVTALREMRRVLRSGGRLGVVVWSTAETVPCVAVPHRVLAAILPPPTPQERLPGPLELSRAGLLEELVAEAGFRAIAVERQTCDYIVEDPEMLWRYHADEGPPPMRAAVAALDPAARRDLHDQMMAAAEAYRRAGSIRLPSEAIYAMATR